MLPELVKEQNRGNHAENIAKIWNAMCEFGRKSVWKIKYSAEMGSLNYLEKAKLE